METDVERYNPIIAERLFGLSRMLNISCFTWNGVLKYSTYKTRDGHVQVCPSIYNSLFELLYEQITLLNLDGPTIADSMDETDLVAMFISYNENPSSVEVTLLDDNVYELYFSRTGEFTHHYLTDEEEEDEEEEFY